MADTVIKVEGLSKKFCTSLKRSMLYGTYDALRDMAGIAYDASQLRKNEFWALTDIDFELKRGETLGLIGQNGCGKTTLLRLLNGIFPPDKGEITINGRIGALIAVGAGFHPHMTGRENIYLNGTILGMHKTSIKQKFDSIIDFAEIGEFIDAPVATYSSGMTIRLGFAIAIHCEPDILLIDEILAVGDLRFRMKCFSYIDKLLKERKTASILVSHNMIDVMRVCRKGILLEKGQITRRGDITSIISEYNIQNSINQITLKTNEETIREICITNSEGNVIDKIRTSEDIYFLFEVDSKRYYSYIRCNLHIDHSSGRLSSTSSILDNFVSYLEIGINRFSVKLSNFPFLANGYILYIDIYGKQIGELICCSDPKPLYVVSENIDYYGFGQSHIIKMNYDWKKIK